MIIKNISSEKLLLTILGTPLLPDAQVEIDDFYIFKETDAFNASKVSQIFNLVQQGKLQIMSYSTDLDQYVTRGELESFTGTDMASVKTADYFQATNVMALTGTYSTVVTAQFSGKIPGGDATHEGVITVAPSNRVPLRNAANQDPFVFTDDEIYGRISYSAGVWTLSYYYYSDNVEYPFIWPANYEVEWVYLEVFNLLNKPVIPPPMRAFSDQTNTGVVIGFQGYQGFQGSQGWQGRQGWQGNQGFQGNQGIIGIGTQGNQGNQGNAGSNGSTGADGNQGNQGAQGRQGSAGFQGDFGPQGFQGNDGTQGFQGTNPGVQGPQGRQGFQGAVGGQGNQGRQGFQGIAGTAGGPQGNQGFQGNQGRQGFQGNQGRQGSQGWQGSAGADGFQGYQGNQGNQGYQGEGVQGFQGTNPGPQGPQGTNPGVQGPQGSISPFDAVPSDLGYSGEAVSLTYGESITAGDPLYIKNDGTVCKANASVSGTFPVMGLAMETAASGSHIVLLRGFYRNDALFAFSIGGVVYLSITGTLAQIPAVGSGYITQVLGIATHADRLYFNPSLDYITNA